MILASAVVTGIYTSIVVNLAKQHSLEQEKHTIEGEVNAVREIQMSMVPEIFTIFSLWTGIILSFYWEMFPGKEFLLHCLWPLPKLFLKQLPMRVPVSIKFFAEYSEGNDMSMFAAVFCAVIDIRTGNVEYSNACHNPPVLCRW
jgi:sigma-B regulation protein RsbU (phosphoserine phosphatase)